MLLPTNYYQPYSASHYTNGQISGFTFLLLAFDFGGIDPGLGGSSDEVPADFVLDLQGFLA